MKFGKLVNLRLSIGVDFMEEQGKFLTGFLSNSGVKPLSSEMGI
jgi:hypothetical protein